MIKQARQNLTVYVNQYFTERNGSIGSKHVFVGNTRVLTKVTGGTNFIRSYDGYTGAKVPPGQGAEKANKGKGADKGNHGRHLGQAKDHTDQGQHLGQAKNAEKGQGNRGKNVDRPNNGKADDGKAATTPTLGAHPGQGLAHRAERANEVAQNTCRNKRLAPLYCPDAGGGDTPPEDGTDPGEETPGTPPAQELIKVSMGEQLFYYHPDHLGSTSYVTRENGKVHEHLQYFPFGETWIQQGGNTEKSPYLFTAKELDEETGLYYFGARYYDPRTSVWQSPDPILEKYLPDDESGRHLPGFGGVYNSKNLGLYSYSHLNPVIYNDPDGNVVKLVVSIIKVAAKGGDVYSTVSGIVDNARIIANPNASLGEKLAAAADIALDVGTGVNTKDIRQLAEKAGGAYKDLKATRGVTQRHHLPSQDSLKKSGTTEVSRDDGPSIVMDIRDHRKTSSHDSQGPVGAEYRQEIADMIKEGDWRGAMAKEVRDVRRAAQEGSGDRTKYNQALREALQYAKEKGLLDKQ